MNGITDLVQTFVKHCSYYQDAEKAYEETVEYGEIFHLNDDLNAFKEFYKTFGGAINNGITTAI